MSNAPRLINAICTLLQPDESLHRDGLAAHLEAQWKHGISDLLVGGTMGLMQHLRDDTYRDLIQHSVELARGRGELLVGVGDTSYARTRARMEVAQKSKIDGLVVLTPYFYKYTRADLIHYFKTLADEATVPLFVYYLPGLTGVTMDIPMVVELSKHPNIRGIKCSCDYAWSHQLRSETASDFRIIVAQPLLLGPLIRLGVQEHLDGIYAVLPALTQRIVESAVAGKWEQMDKHQAVLARVFECFRLEGLPVFPACETLLNVQGIPGKCCTAPMRPLDAKQKETLLANPAIREALAT